MKAWKVSAFQIAKNNVSYDLLEDEVIAIHFDTGTYYSMQGTAKEIWLRLAEPISLNVLASHFVGIEAQDTRLLQSFLDSLKEEGLVTNTEGDGSLTPGNGEIGIFSEPIFEKYTDMQALLLADPIHDVQQQAGWPHLKTDIDA
jgi:hypothetical protein